MVQLDLLRNQLSLRTKKVRDLSHLWDEVRKKWVRMTPEELVRQLVIQHLLELGFSPRLLQVEKQVLYHGMARRFDLVAYQKELIPFLLVECKSPDIAINQKAFDQIAQYNMSLTVPFLWVTNGKTNYCCQMDYEVKTYTFLDHIPVPG
jgi:predicted type IV restriction endonuclease